MSAAELRKAAETLRERADDTDTDSWSLPCNQNPHVLSLNTDVANALADWLDATAQRVEDAKPWRQGGRNNHSWRGSREALTVARLIVGHPIESRGDLTEDEARSVVNRLKARKAEQGAGGQPAEPELFEAQA